MLLEELRKKLAEGDDSEFPHPDRATAPTVDQLLDRVEAVRTKLADILARYSEDVDPRLQTDSAKTMNRLGRLCKALGKVAKMVQLEEFNAMLAVGSLLLPEEQELELAGLPVNRIHLTLSGPVQIEPGDSATIRIWAHRKDERDRIRRLIKDDTETSWLPEEGAEPSRTIVIVPHLDGLNVEPVETVFTWRGQIGRATLTIRVPQETHHGPKRALLDLRVAGLRAATADFSIDVGEPTAEPSPIASDLTAIGTAYACFATEDEQDVRSRVRELRGMSPNTMVVSAVWHEKPEGDGDNDPDVKDPERMIHDADVLYLFWSEKASMSPSVARELGFARTATVPVPIDVVPLDSSDDATELPDITPMPQEAEDEAPTEA